MKAIITVLAFALLAMPVQAAANQQEKAKACNAAASKKELKGDKRKAFIKGCLSAKAKTKPQTAAAPEPKPKPRAAPPVAAPAATPGAQPAATPAAPPAAQKPNAVADKKRFQCEDFARQSNVSPSSKKGFMDKCMAG